MHMPSKMQRRSHNISEGKVTPTIKETLPVILINTSGHIDEYELPLNKMVVLNGRIGLCFIIDFSNVSAL